VKITKIQNASPEKLEATLNNIINNYSRFNAKVVMTGSSLSVKQIRLKESKPYCGNHPIACEVIPGNKVRKANYLEGADWVEFNDLLNDVCDWYCVSANIRSAVCIVRKDVRRRTHYGYASTGRINVPWEWRMDEDDKFYVDYRVKRAPDSSFPDGTPGIYCRINIHCFIGQLEVV